VRWRTTGRTGPGRRWPAIAALVAVLAAMAGCGIGTDEAAREIPAGAVPESLRQDTSPTTAPPEDPDRARMVTIYLVRSDRGSAASSLEAVEVPVPTSGSVAESAAAATVALALARPDSLGRPDLLNAVPPGMQVLRAEMTSDGVLDLDVTELDAVEGSLQRLAVAQIVFTLTGLTTRIDAVRFSVEGAAVAVPVENGSIPAGQPVRRSDDPSLLTGPRASTTTSTTTTR
jgi:spore germination protein GerM